MSRGNGYGNYRTTIEQDIAAHDACPPLLRHAAAYAVGKWASGSLLKEWRNGVPERVLVRAMIEGDRRQTVKDYGRRHPEAGID